MRRQGEKPARTLPDYLAAHCPDPLIGGWVGFVYASAEQNWAPPEWLSGEPLRELRLVAEEGWIRLQVAPFPAEGLEPDVELSLRAARRRRSVGGCRTMLCVSVGGPSRWRSCCARARRSTGRGRWARSRCYGSMWRGLLASLRERAAAVAGTPEAGRCEDELAELLRIRAVACLNLGHGLGSEA